jgi:hypothetical protein
MYKIFLREALDMQLKLASKLKSSCLSLPSVEIRRVFHYNGAYRVDLRVSTMMNFTITTAPWDGCHVPHMRNEEH